MVVLDTPASPASWMYGSFIMVVVDVRLFKNHHVLIATENHIRVMQEIQFAES